MGHKVNAGGDGLDINAVSSSDRYRIKSLSVHAHERARKRFGESILRSRSRLRSKLMKRQQLRELMDRRPAASRILCLKRVVHPVEIVNDIDYEYVMDEVRSECEEFGSLVKLVIPRPVDDPYDEEVSSESGVGKVFVEYEDVETATKAQRGLDGRKFGGIYPGIPVVADFYPEYNFSQGDYRA